MYSHGPPCSLSNRCQIDSQSSPNLIFKQIFYFVKLTNWYERGTVQIRRCPMSKCVQKKRLSADKIASIFEGLSRLMPSNRPSTREVLESQQAVILAAIARGNSLRDIVNFLTKKGLNVSHESLRKIVLLWQSGVASGVKPESKKGVDIQNVEGAAAVKNGTISRQAMGCSV